MNLAKWKGRSIFSAMDSQTMMNCCRTPGSGPNMEVSDVSYNLPRFPEPLPFYVVLCQSTQPEERINDDSTTLIEFFTENLKLFVMTSHDK